MTTSAHEPGDLQAADRAFSIPFLCAGSLGLLQIFVSTRLGVLADAAVWAASIMLCAALLRWWVPEHAAGYLGAVSFFCLVIGVGLLECVTVTLWLLSAYSLGALVSRWLFGTGTQQAGLVVSLALGSSLWLAIWGVMLHFPVNYRPLHIALTLVPLLVLLKDSRILLPGAAHAAISAQRWVKAIRFELWTLGLVIVGWVLRWASFPSVGFDDQALHLRMWTELSTLHRYSFDVVTQVWSVAPFGVDMLHAGLSLMAGADARGALNLGLVLLMFLLMARMLHGWAIAPRVQWALIALMASTPLLGGLLLTLHTELALAVFVLAGVYLATHAEVKLYGQHAWGVVACAALCTACKLPGLVLGGLLVAVFLLTCFLRRSPMLSDPSGTQPGSSLIQSRRFERPWPALALLSVLTFLALHSYGMAWYLTGNPVFPLYNAIFASSYFPLENFSDARWIHGFTFSNFVKAFFKTSIFVEASDYTAGWQYLMLVPFACITAMRRNAPLAAKLCLVPLIGFVLLMFSATQYWRYLFPVMPLAGVLIGVLLIQVNPLFGRLVICVIACSLVANLIFFTGFSLSMSTPASFAVTESGKRTLIGQYAPVASLSEQVNAIAPGARVLYPPELPYGAKLHGTPIYVNWYAPLRASRFNSVKHAGAMQTFLAQEQIDFVILGAVDPQIEITAAQLLREHLASFGVVVAQESGYTLYRLSDKALRYRPAFGIDSFESIRQMHNGVFATPTPQSIANFSSERAQQARYSVQFACDAPSDSFVAQVNWDKGPAYYRLVSCRAKDVRFSEAIAIPIGAKTGAIYLSVRGESTASVRELQVELY